MTLAALSVIMRYDIIETDDFDGPYRKRRILLRLMQSEDRQRRKRRLFGFLFYDRDRRLLD